MDRNDSQAIDQLFGKLALVEQQSPPRDNEAEAFIRDKIASQPGAPYYMAQTIVVQDRPCSPRRPISNSLKPKLLARRVVVFLAGCSAAAGNRVGLLPRRPA